MQLLFVIQVDGTDYRNCAQTAQNTGQPHESRDLRTPASPGKLHCFTLGSLYIYPFEAESRPNNI
jgi:hypothetical protein